jgi:hypothetical protein
LEQPEEKAQGSWHDSRGRFTPGNPGGPGGSRSRATELRRAAENAITVEHIGALIRKATRMGLEGNLAAMRLVFERTTGRPIEAQPEAEPIPLTLPRLQTASECAKATDKVLDGMCRGVVDRDTARVMLEGIQTRLKAIETVDLEARLAEIEKAASVVDFGGRRKRG